jgi:hypothetical protein
VDRQSGLALVVLTVDCAIWLLGLANSAAARGAAVLAPTPNKLKLTANKSAKTTGMAIAHQSRSRAGWGRDATPAIVKVQS